MADNWNAEFKRHIAPGEAGSYRETTDGKFVFVAPIEGSDVYDIKYTDGDRRGSMQYVVNAGDCVSCDCGKISYNAPSGKISSNGGNNVTLGTNFKITHAYCEKNYTPTFTPGDNVSNVHLDGTTIKGNVPSNNGEEREITFSVNFNGHVCPNTDKYHLKQEHGCTCTNSSYSYNQTKTSVPAGGYNGTVGTISMNHGCSVDRITVESSNMTVSRSGNNIVANIPENPGDTRTLTYSIKINGSVCSGPYSITQDAGASCDKVSFNQSKTGVPYYAQTNVTIGTYSNSGPGTVTVQSLSDGLTVRLNGNTVIADVSDNPTPSQPRTLNFRLNLNGNPCSSYSITQSRSEVQAYRVTDNGSDYLDGVWVSHPLNFSYKSEDGNGDSIDALTLYVVKDGQRIPIIGVPSDYAGTSYEYETRTFTYGGQSYTIYPNKTLRYGGQTIRINDWYEVYWDDRRSEWHNDDVGALGIKLTQNNGSGIRSEIITLDTNDSVVAPWAGSTRAGKQAAHNYQYQIQQAPYGYEYWCGDHTYTEVPSRTPCDE